MAAIRYIVSDVPRAVAFYTANLGFTVKKEVGAAIANVTRDDLSLWLSGPESSAGRPLSDGQVPVPGGWNRILLETDDLDAWIAKLSNAQARFRGGVVAGPGGKKILVEDPDGNPIELFEGAS